MPWCSIGHDLFCPKPCLDDWKWYAQARHHVELQRLDRQGRSGQGEPLIACASDSRSAMIRGRT